jgi:hypothetical protein
MGVAFVVDDQDYEVIGEIEDVAVRELIQSAIEEWQTRGMSSPDSIEHEEATVARKPRRKGEDWIVAFLPVAIAFACSVVNPDYFMQLLWRQPPFLTRDLPCGWALAAITVLLMFSCRISF